MNFKRVSEMSLEELTALFPKDPAKRPPPDKMLNIQLAALAEYYRRTEPSKVESLLPFMISRIQEILDDRDNFSSYFVILKKDGEDNWIWAGHGSHLRSRAPGTPVDRVAVEVEGLDALIGTEKSVTDLLKSQGFQLLWIWNENSPTSG